MLNKQKADTKLPIGKTINTLINQRSSSSIMKEEEEEEEEEDSWKSGTEILETICHQRHSEEKEKKFELESSWSMKIAYLEISSLPRAGSRRRLKEPKRIKVNLSSDRWEKLFPFRRKLSSSSSWQTIDETYTTTTTTTTRSRWMIFSLLILLNHFMEQTSMAAAELIDGAPSGIEGTSEAFIKVTRFQVPKMAKWGDSVRLICLYELYGERLHAMKLFKDDKEFYRYTPSANREDQRLSWPLKGVVVDLEKSNEREIYLRPVNKHSSGTYKCQVSVENTFRSVSTERNMEVKPKNSSASQDTLGFSSTTNRAQQQPQRHSAAPTSVQFKQHQVASPAASLETFSPQQSSSSSNLATQQQHAVSAAGRKRSSTLHHVLVHIALTLLCVIPFRCS